MNTSEPDSMAPIKNHVTTEHAIYQGFRFMEPFWALSRQWSAYWFSLFFFLFFLVPGFVYPGTGDEDASWRKAISDDQYPPLYTDDFIDSLFSEKEATIAQNFCSVESKPFCAGETLVYNMGWGLLHAGYALLTTAPDTVNGTTVIIGKGATNSFFSNFYKIRDHYRTIIDQEGLYPLFFEQHVREGKYRSNRWELYDQSQNIVFTDKETPPSFESKPFSHSLMSLVYYLRTLKFGVGDSMKIDCFVDTMVHTILMKCVKRKDVTVAAGTFDCLLVKPYLIGKGRVFSKSDEIRVWFTNDKYKMPIAIESRIAWGTLYARLMWYSRKG
jgi:hypothetical protein